MFCGSFFVSGACEFRRTKIAKSVVPVVYHYLRHPFFSAWHVGYAFVAACIIFLDAAVKLVFGRRCFPQIFPAVVRRVSIDVIDLSARPISSNVNPCQSMRRIFASSNSYFDAPLIGFVSCDAAYRVAVRECYFPADYASVLIVTQDAAYEFCRQVVVRAFVRFHLSRAASTMRRITSEMLIPSSLARALIHSICGTVNTIDRWMVFIWTRLCVTHGFVKGVHYAYT